MRRQTKVRVPGHTRRYDCWTEAYVRRNPADGRRIHVRGYYRKFIARILPYTYIRRGTGNRWGVA